MRPTLAFALSFTLLAACSGRIVGDDDPPGGTSRPATRDGRPGPLPPSSPTSATASPAACAAAEPRVGASPLRRLTRAEYDNTVRDLLGDATKPAADFPAEDRIHGFSNNAQHLLVTPLLAERLQGAAERVAARAVGDGRKLTGCVAGTAASEGPCMRQFVQIFGGRAFRRPLAPDEVDELQGVWARARASWDFPTSVRLLLETVLQYPDFLYRLETGTPIAPGSAIARLGGHELAVRLSYLFWQSMPDDELARAAQAGTLASTAGIRAQAERLLRDPRARAMAASFHRQWLQLTDVEALEKDTSIFPQWRPETPALLASETDRFVEHVVFDGDGRVGTLLTASFTFLNARLAAFYGVGGVSGDALARVELDTTRRRGLLTHASLLASQAKGNQTSPVVRGLFVRDQILCARPPDPPEDTDLRPPEPDTARTTRERFAAHSVNPACAACHKLMDPIGLGLENYDGIGRWRDLENGKAIDARGEIVGSDVAGAFDGPMALVERLGRSADAQACATLQWFRFAAGRTETAEDGCLLADLGRAATVRDMLLAFVTTADFLHRRAGAGGAP